MAAGRVALVTGAGQGVGAGIAAALASAGCRVLVNDLVPDRASEVASSLGGAAEPLPFDVTDHSAVSAAFATAGPVDVLVNNAGIPVDGFPQTPFASSDPAVWRRFVDLNLYGVMNCTHVALPGMIERGWGRVITISSEAGRHGLDIGVSLYGAAKAGALGLMRHVAVEVAPFGVTVNSVSLGLIAGRESEWADRVARTVPAAPARYAERRRRRRRVPRVRCRRLDHRPGAPGERRCVHRLSPVLAAAGVPIRYSSCCQNGQ